MIWRVRFYLIMSLLPVAILAGIAMERGRPPHLDCAPLTEIMDQIGCGELNKCMDARWKAGFNPAECIRIFYPGE